MTVHPKLWLLPSIFFFDFLFTRILGQSGEGRILVIARSITHLALLLLLAAILIGFRSRGDVRMKSFDCAVPSRAVNIAFGIFIALAIFSAVIGFGRGHGIVYALGDLYRFLLLPFGILVIYNAILTEEDLQNTVAAVVSLYLPFLVFYIMLYAVGILKINVRPALIYYYPIMLLLLWYCRAVMAKGYYTVLVVIYLGCAPPLIWFSQSLTLIAQIFIFAGMTTVFYLGFRRALGIILKYLMPAVLLATLFAIWVIIETEFKIQFSPTTYLFAKFYFLQKTAPSLLLVELLLGDRVAQVVAVIQYYLAHPVEALTGQGMGGEIFVSPLSEMEKATWDYDTHFIEAGYADVLLRTGLLGLVCYSGFLFLMFRHAWRNARSNSFCALAAAYSFYLLIFSWLNVAFLGPLFFFAGLMFAGIVRTSRVPSSDPILV